MTNAVAIEGVHAWIEQEGMIHVKAVSEYGDPIELTADAARAVATRLQELADQLDSLDASDR